MTAIDFQNELTLDEPDLIAEPVVGGRRSFVRRFLEQRAAVAALAVLVLIVLVATFAPVLAP